MSLAKTCLAALLIGTVSLSVLPNTTVAQRGDPIPQKNFSNLIAALSNVNSEIRALENREVQNILFANVNEMRTELDERQNQQLDEAIEEADLDTLHDFLAEDESFKRALREKHRDSVSVNEVIAVDMLSDGDVLIYFAPTI